jgi:hypothetical protein
MSQPPPNPAAPVLNYLGPTAAQRHASGGLMFMGGGIILLALIPFLDSYRLLRWYPSLLAVALLALVACWGTAYIIMALLIRLGRTRAAWPAMMMVIVQCLLLLAVSIFVVGSIVERDGLEATPFPLALFLIINIGFGSVIFELRKVIRESDLSAMRYTDLGRGNIEPRRHDDTT